MKIGIQYLAMSLVVGVIAGLLLSSFIETPLNPTKVVTSTITNTTTVTTTTLRNETVNIWPYSLSFFKYGCGPSGWGYDIGIWPNGLALVFYNGEKGRDITSARILTKPELDNLSSIVQKANVFSLNNSYPSKPGFVAVCHYSLGLQTSNLSKGVSWLDEMAAVDYTPKELQEIVSYFDTLVNKMVK